MFGVMVVEGGDRLRAFSGMLDGRWEQDGFVPPAFDARAKDAVWAEGEREMRARAEEIEALERAPERAALEQVRARQRAEGEVMAARHAVARAARHAARAAGGADLHALAQASRADTAERRKLDAQHAEARGAIEARVGELDRELAACVEARAARSRELLVQIQDAYGFASARGERKTLRELFAPAEPPGGAGNCAAPKLFAEAYRRGLRPVAIAELWWGATPATGGRYAGRFYPACRGSCGPILAHMMDGLEAEPPPVYGGGPIAADEPKVVFEDRWLVVVEKPVGLLSVPGRGGALKDSVQARLRARYAQAMVVHRLDLDTSGLMIASRDEATFAAMQRGFARREIEKRYVAWLEGEVAGDAGEIELALRVDLDDRPRQIVDAVHGKHAVTRWRVVARAPGRTRVELTPLTGRTHQLRVHAAVGLGAPIAGDRLYGREEPGDRLMLHAEAIAFTHPQTGEQISLERPAPF
jgi:tRNA pseudouridine32 synthase/23S rRNA pseudouridine746 synthase